MKAPVSVIITCRNLERYLGEAVESVRAQTMQPMELIIVHDFCDHPTSYAHATTVIRDYHKGVARSRLEGFKLSICPYILFLDADDALTENFLEECMKLKDKADILYPDTLLWSHWGKEPKDNAWHRAGNKVTFKCMIRSNRWLVVSSLMKREVFESLGGFDSELPMYEDWDFWLRAIKAGYTFKKANTYLKYRQRTNSRNRKDDEIKRNTLSLIREKHAES